MARIICEPHKCIEPFGQRNRYLILKMTFFIMFVFSIMLLNMSGNSIAHGAGSSWRLMDNEVSFVSMETLDLLDEYFDSILIERQLQMIHNGSTKRERSEHVVCHQTDRKRILIATYWYAQSDEMMGYVAYSLADHCISYAYVGDEVGLMRTLEESYGRQYQWSLNDQIFCANT